MDYLNNYRNLLSPILGEIFTGTTITQYLSEIYIEFGINVLSMGQYESKARYLERSLSLLDDEQTFKTILFLAEKIKDPDSAAKVMPKIDKMKRQFPEYDCSGSILNQELVEETKHWLNDYPKALEEYTNAEKQYTENDYQRNLLDNLRLSLELLIKDLTGVDKSIENQNINNILGTLKSIGVSNELRSMIRSLIDYYSKYHNNFVKHDSLVAETEIEVIFELTSTIMKFLIRELSK